MIEHNQMKIMKFDSFFSTRSRAKIMKTMVLHQELNITQLCKLTHTNHAVVKKDLLILMEMGFVQEKTYGRIRIYRYRMENLLARAIMNLIIFWENEVEKC